MNNRVIAATVLMLGAIASSAQAQQARSGGGASAAVLQQLQQVASERTELAARNAKLQQDLDAMRKERDTIKAAQSVSDHRAAQTEAAVRDVQQQAAAAKQKAADDNVARWKTQMDELVAKYRELAQTLHDTEASRTGLQQQVATQQHTLSVCTDNNASLYNLNTEVLDHFQNQSTFSGLARAEPFTRVARTRLENAALEYKERAAALRDQATRNAAKGGT